MREAQASAADTSGRMRYIDYTVGWICALPKEMAAGEAMLDEIHETLPTGSNDINTYTLGRIGSHNIVMASLPAGQYGTNNAAIVGTNMTRTFPFIQKWLLVGIGGGVPDFKDIRLGDVVVSDQVIQYDLGKCLPNGQFHRTSIPTRPAPVLMTAVSKLQAQYCRVLNSIPLLIEDMLQRHSPRMSEYRRPQTPDILFAHSYNHNSSSINASCQECSQAQQVRREARGSDSPAVHFGKIASGNQVIKDGTTRQVMATELDVICFEMEAAGLMEGLSCLVIRGICDYSDSHKNKEWQEHAAATAAAYAKDLLLLTSISTMQASAGEAAFRSTSGQLGSPI